MNTDNENYSDSSDESDYTENEEEVQVLTIPKNIVELPKSIEKLKRTKSKKITVVKQKKKTPKPTIIYVSSDEEQEPEEIIIKPKRKVGRPKSTKVVYHDKEGKVVKSRNKAKETVISLPEPDKKFTSSELKMIALEEKVLELEQISGKKILTTKKSKIDKRSTKAPSEKQLEARKKFVENNRIRAAERKAKKLADAKEEGKASAAGVIDELKTEKAKSTKMKKELLQEIETMKSQEKEVVVKKQRDSFFD